MQASCLLRRPVEAALLDLVHFPPPAAGTFVLTFGGGAGAGGAADRGVAEVVERVVGEVVLVDVRPDLVSGPISQRGDLGEAFMRGIGRNDRRFLARWRLVPAQAGDPRVVSRQRAGQRPRLAHVAAQAPHVCGLVEEVRAMGRDHLVQIVGVGRDDLDVDPVAVADAVDHVVGLLREAAGVQGEHGHVGPDARGHVDKDGRLGLEAGHDHDLWKRVVCPLQNGFRGAHTVTWRSDSKPTRSTQLPKPSPAWRSVRNVTKSGLSRSGMPAIGTLVANTRFRRVPSKSPASITSYLPSVVPTNPTSPRYGLEQPLGQPLMRKLIRSSARPTSSSSFASWRMREGSARSASATARPQVGMAGHAMELR